MNTPLQAQIQARIETFVQELGDLVKQAALESVQIAFAGGAPARRRPGRPRGSKAAAPRRRAGKRIRRSADQLEAMAADILAHVRANPGQGVEEIGAALGLTSKELRRPVTMLTQADKLRSEGRKRGTRYFAGGGRRKKASRKTGRRKATRRATRGRSRVAAA